MTLTIVTINFNGAHDTTRLLDSLQKQTDKAFDVIVIDNDSAQDDRAILGKYSSSSPIALDVIYQQRNLGFSGGNNIGIRKALTQGAEWVVLINNDTVVQPDFVASLRSSLSNHPAIVGLPLDEGEHTAYSGRLDWLASTLKHNYSPETGNDSYAIGAGFAIHREVFDRIGMMDEHYFLYFEDADFSARARRAGIPVEFVSRPVVRHFVSGTTKALGSPTLLRYHFRNAIRFNRLHAPLWARLVLPFWILGHGVKQCVKIAIDRARPQSRAILAGLRDGILGRGGNIMQRPVIAVECETLEDTSWGMARQVRGFLEEFVLLPEVQSSYDVVAYFKSRIPDEPWLKHPNVRAVIVRPIPWLPPSFSLYFYVFFPIRLWFDRPAVTYIANYMLPILFRGKCIIMLTEDIWYEMRGSALPFHYRLAYRIFANWAARHATRIMAITHASGRRVAELFGISPQRVAVNELAVSEPLNVQSREGTYLLYVAQGLPRRHLRETILAFARIAHRRPELTLFAIGPDKYQPNIIEGLVENTNKSLGREAVIWTQRVSDEDLARAYAGATTFVYVSDMEAFGLPPLEALSYGVPSVLMDTPVHRELFGKHAFYTHAADTDSIEAALEKSLNDTEHRNRIRDAAQSLVSRYTWHKHAQRMLAVIEDII